MNERKLYIIGSSSGSSDPSCIGIGSAKPCPSSQSTSRMSAEDTINNLIQSIPSSASTVHTAVLALILDRPSVCTPLRIFGLYSGTRSTRSQSLTQRTEEPLAPFRISELCTTLDRSKHSFSITLEFKRRFKL